MVLCALLHVCVCVFVCSRDCILVLESVFIYVRMYVDAFLNFCVRVYASARVFGSMNVECGCVSEFVSVCSCVFMCTCVCMFVHLYLCACSCVFVLCMFVRVYACKCACVTERECVCVSVWMCLCLCIFV
jgi:hypothetical protein